MASPAERIDAAFGQLAARVAGGQEQAVVTVRSVDGHSGQTVATAEGVTALKRSRRRQMFGVQQGQLASDTSRFILKASEVGFYPKHPDEIETAAGVVWIVSEASAIAFDTLYACDVVIKRG